MVTLLHETNEIQRHKEENGYFVQNSPCVNNSSIFIPKNLRKYPT